MIPTIDATADAGFGGPRVQRGKSRQDYETPRVFFDAVEARFGRVAFDLAATAANAKAARFFTLEPDPGKPGGVQADALHSSWWELSSTGLLWLNPPFANIGPWVKKCWDESQRGARIVVLVPASIGSNWFRDFVHQKAGVIGLNGRITFVGEEQPYPKDCMLLHYGPHAPGFGVWTWTNQD